MTQLIPSLLPPKRTYVPRSSVPEESYRKGWHLFLWNARVRQCPTLGPPGPLNPRSPSSIPYSFLSLPLFPILTPYLSWYLWVSPPLPIGGVPPFAHASYPNSSGGDLRVVQYVNSSINLRLCQLRYCDQTPRYTTCSSPITPNPFRALPYAKINSLLPHSLTQPHFPHDCEILPSQQPSNQETPSIMLIYPKISISNPFPVNTEISRPFPTTPLLLRQGPPLFLSTPFLSPSWVSPPSFRGCQRGNWGKCPQGGYPELVFPAGYQVECLHGRHRIQAAKELGLEWWTVDLYLAGGLILSVDNNDPDRCLEQTSNLT
jgi:hypothetical protein